MRPIDADALIEFCAERWIPLNIDAVNMQPTIQPEKAQLSRESATSDLISRQAAIDALNDWSEHSMTDAEAWHIRQVIGDIKSMPSAQPEQPERCSDCEWWTNQPEIIRCKDCGHFHYDMPYVIQGVPVLGHEVCDFWGDGCKTSENGYCSFAERRTDG